MDTKGSNTYKSKSVDKCNDKIFSYKSFDSSGFEVKLYGCNGGNFTHLETQQFRTIYKGRRCVLFNVVSKFCQSNVRGTFVTSPGYLDFIKSI